MSKRDESEFSDAFLILFMIQVMLFSILLMAAAS